MSDLQLCALYILSYITNTPVLKLAKMLIDGVNSQIRVFNYISRWRKGITLLTYIYGYVVGYSFFRKSYVLG
ncbi:hypothetical protein [Thermocrinis sp.]|uniref:hypothetical protein n=1 Tax=Thermocrinis sp. TaxID=2024383 RepID=UPI002FDCA8DC